MTSGLEIRKSIIETRGLLADFGSKISNFVFGVRQEVYGC